MHTHTGDAHATTHRRTRNDRRSQRHTHARARTHTHTHTHTPTHTHAKSHTRTHTHALTHRHARAHMHACPRTHAHAHAYTRNSTRTYARTSFSHSLEPQVLHAARLAFIDLPPQVGFCAAASGIPRRRKWDSTPPQVGFHGTGYASTCGRRSCSASWRRRTTWRPADQAGDKGTNNRD